MQKFFFRKIDMQQKSLMMRETDFDLNGWYPLTLEHKLITQEKHYRSGTVNSKSFVGKVLLRIKRKFELTYAL